MCLIHSNQDNNSKKYKAERYYLSKGVIKHYNFLISGENLYDQHIDYDIKRYEEIRKLTTRQGEDYTRGCLLDYE